MGGRCRAHSVHRLCGCEKGRRAEPALRRLARPMLAPWDRPRDDEARHGGDGRRMARASEPLRIRGVAGFTWPGDSLAIARCLARFRRGEIRLTRSTVGVLDLQGLCRTRAEQGTQMNLRRSVIVAIVALVSSLPGVARADGCVSGCSNNQHICTMQARIESVACMRGCPSGDLQCRLDCRTAMVANRVACRSQRMDCATSCSPAILSPDSASVCAPGCGTDTRACSIDMRMGGVACIRQCLRAGSSGMADCLGQCAAELRSGGASCSATFQGCLEGCGGQGSGACFDTLTGQCTAQACSQVQPCSQPNEFCSPRCAPGPSSGQCFDTVGMQCTGQTCSSDQPCALPNQVCLSQCPPPTPTGKCFDTAAQQCTDEACSPGQACSGSDEICTLQCPPPPPSGQCFDVIQRQCTDQKCGPDQPCPSGQRCLASCPLPTPTPQCGGDACGGRCLISPPCPGDLPCPANAAVLLGQCETAAAGDCACVPYAPPTPTPQCGGDVCGGQCFISPPCPPGGPCPEIATRLGQCEIASSGNCECVPYAPPTPTPQCGGDVCGGKCLISPCPPGAECFAPTRPGQCEATSSGACECVPVVPPTPTPTPAGAGGTPSPTPPPVDQCGGDTCGGKCWISPCPPGVPCPALSAALSGQCEITSSGSCECVPYVPPTPTPQCSGDVCGAASSPLSFRRPVPESSSASASSPRRAPVPPTPTPQCSARLGRAPSCPRAPTAKSATAPSLCPASVRPRTRGRASACPTCRRRRCRSAAATSVAGRARSLLRALLAKCAPRSSRDPVSARPHLRVRASAYPRCRRRHAAEPRRRGSARSGSVSRRSARAAPAAPADRACPRAFRTSSAISAESAARA